LGGPNGLAGVGTSPGAHLLHVGGSSFGGAANIICSTCHTGGMPGFWGNVYSKLTIGFEINGVAGGAYDGAQSYANNPNDVPYTLIGANGTTVTQYGSQTCTTIYCHSQGTGGTANQVTLLPAALPTQPAYGTSPNWVSGTAQCNSCHGNTTYTDWRAAAPLYAQDSPKANSHQIHIQTGFTCNYCHYATTTDGVTITNPANHANGVYDVVPDGSVSLYGASLSFSYTYDPGGGKCSSISCHQQLGMGQWQVWGGEMLSNTAFQALADKTVCFQVDFSASSATFSSYYWDFGDGTNSVQAAPSHAYPGANTYYVTLYARDADNHRGQTTQPVNASAFNQPPVAAKSLTANGLTVTLTDLSYDPDYNQCGHSGPGSITVQWGDGNTETHSINLTNTPSNQTYTHTYSISGSSQTFNVLTSVTDNAGGYASNSQSVTVLNTFTISGNITHKGGSGYSAGQPCVSCKVYLMNTKLNVIVATNYTDSNGNYTFPASGSSQYVPYYVVPSVAGLTFTPQYSGPYSSTTSNVNFTATP